MLNSFEELCILQTAAVFKEPFFITLEKYESHNSLSSFAEIAGQ